jgi:DNA-binding beta-propeller fold protein YncE
MNRTNISERAAYWRAYQRAGLLVTAMILVTAASSRLRADTGLCGGASTTLPFTDVAAANVFFCSIAEAYFSGLTNGTGPGVYSPAANVTREQMAAFVTRTLDQSVRRGSNRAALDQYWTIHGANNLASTTVGDAPNLIKSDGTDVWVANFVGNTVSQVRASDGKLVDTWTGATSAYGVLCAMGKVFVTGWTSPGKLYQIDSTQAAGPVTTLSSGLGGRPRGIAYDGQRIWTANSGSISIITLNPLSVTTAGDGFLDVNGIIYDGSNIWVTNSDFTPAVDQLRKLDSNGATLLSVDVGDGPRFPAFDGTNIWVPNTFSNTVSVVRATGALAGTVLATLSGNGLDAPFSAAFDGERILVTDSNNGTDAVSLWKASDFTPIGTSSTGLATSPFGACSDGLNFWITLFSADKVARF